jgi:hypothetical protein
MKQRIAPWRTIVLTGLVGLNISLAATAAFTLLSGDAPALPHVDWTPPIANAGPVPSDAKPIARYLQTLAHPIFFKTREPFVAPRPPLHRRPRRHDRRQRLRWIQASYSVASW